MKIRTEKIIDVAEWDSLVEETYGKPYSFQQQDDCKERGMHYFKVPDKSWDDEMNDSIPEVVNHREMGVKFEAWKARDPKTPLNDPEDRYRTEEWAIRMWWERNFYPDFQTVANDLCEKGLLEPGEYAIDINW